MAPNAAGCLGEILLMKRAASQGAPPVRVSVVRRTSTSLIWGSSARGYRKFFMTANGLDASVRLADEDAGPAACHHQRKQSLMLFEISQVVVGEKHLASRPADENSKR